MENTTYSGWNTVEAIETVTIEIAEVIKQADDNEYDAEIGIADIINNLYERRQILLDELRQWYNSPNGQRELRGNSLEWSGRIDNLIQADTILLENIRRKMDDAQYRLRNIQQTKSLMIYARG